MKRLCLAVPLVLAGCGTAAVPAPRPAIAAAAPSSGAVGAVAAPVHDKNEAALLARIERMSGEVARFAVGRSHELQRPRVRPLALDLSGLASAQIPDPLPNPESPMVGQAPGDATDEIVSTSNEPRYGGREITTSLAAKAVLSMTHVGPWADGKTTASSSNYARCGRDITFNAISPIRWETVTRGADGSLGYEVTDGWFDQRSCKATVVRRTRATARAIVPGYVYGFRACEGACDHASLTLLLPSTSSFVASGAGADATSDVTPSFTRVTVPMEKGGGLSFMAQLGESEQKPWRKELKLDEPAPATSLVVGLEITQGVDEREPIAVGYLADAMGGALDGSVSGLDSFDDALGNRR